MSLARVDIGAQSASDELIAMAPGKLVLAGEYAVTRGGTGLVAAVDRYAVARARSGDGGATTMSHPSAFAAAVQRTLSRVYGADSTEVRTARATAVDTAAFYEAGRKLGYGSSAATTVALVARAIAGASAARGELAARTHPIAAAAHAEAQAMLGHAGSGIDVAAACYGGVLAFANGVAEPLPAPAVGWIPFDTGVVASTPTLLAGVNTAHVDARRTSAVDHALAAIASAADQAISACRIADAAAFIEAMARGHLAMHGLATATGLSLVPAAVDRAATLAAHYHGAAKTCGAGGGDVAIAVVPLDHLPAAQRAFAAAGLRPLTVALGAPGLQRIDLPSP